VVAGFGDAVEKHVDHPGQSVAKPAAIKRSNERQRRASSNANLRYRGVCTTGRTPPTFGTAKTGVCARFSQPGLQKVVAVLRVERRRLYQTGRGELCRDLGRGNDYVTVRRQNLRQPGQAVRRVAWVEPIERIHE
jgi:hypothetical protein